MDNTKLANLITREIIKNLNKEASALLNIKEWEKSLSSYLDVKFKVDGDYFLQFTGKGDINLQLPEIVCEKNTYEISLGSKHNGFSLWVEGKGDKDFQNIKGCYAEINKLEKGDE